MTLTPEDLPQVYGEHYKSVQLETPTTKILFQNAVKSDVIELVEERWGRARSKLCDIAYVLDPMLPLVSFLRQRPSWL